MLISPSPDLSKIAFDPGRVELDQDGNPGNLALVPVERSASPWKSNTIGWKSDSSMLFHIFDRAAREGTTRNPGQEIEVIDVRSGARTIGRLPAGFGYQSPFRPDGVILANGSELLLFLRPVGASGEPEDETNCGVEASERCLPGTVFGCALAPTVSCVPIMSDVDMVSMNEKGTIASIRHTFKKPPRTDGETLLVPDFFNVEIRTRDGRTIARQRYTSKQGLSLQIIMAPQGGKAVVKWTLRGVCGGTGPLQRELCRSASMVDFSDRE